MAYDFYEHDLRKSLEGFSQTWVNPIFTTGEAAKLNARMLLLLRNNPVSPDIEDNNYFTLILKKKLTDKFSYLIFYNYVVTGL